MCAEDVFDCRYTLGEGIEKKTADLGAEVAAQTQALLEKAEAAKNEPKEELPEPDMENTTVKVLHRQLLMSLPWSCCSRGGIYLA